MEILENAGWNINIKGKYIVVEGGRCIQGGFEKIQDAINWINAIKSTQEEK